MRVGPTASLNSFWQMYRGTYAGGLLGLSFFPAVGDDAPITSTSMSQDTVPSAPPVATGVSPPVERTVNTDTLWDMFGSLPVNVNRCEHCDHQFHYDVSSDSERHISSASFSTLITSLFRTATTFFHPQTSTLSTPALPVALTAPAPVGVAENLGRRHHHDLPVPTWAVQLPPNDRHPLFDNDEDMVYGPTD